MADLSQKLAAEGVGTAGLLAIVVGSGIMAEALAGGNIALALLANALATGAGLAVLILAFGPVSGAHFNPAVTLAFYLKKDMTLSHATAFVLVQIIGAVAGVWAAHLMFDLDIFQLSTTSRMGLGQWSAEVIATFGLVATILLVLKSGIQAVAYAVGLYISAAYWFTSSTSFANPAVTIARALSDSFTGIAPVDVAPFVVSQLLGSTLATFFCFWLLKEKAKG